MPRKPKMETVTFRGTLKSISLRAVFFNINGTERCIPKKCIEYSTRKNIVALDLGDTVNVVIYKWFAEEAGFLADTRETKKGDLADPFCCECGELITNGRTYFCSDECEERGMCKHEDEHGFEYACIEDTCPICGKDIKDDYKFLCGEEDEDE